MRRALRYDGVLVAAVGGTAEAPGITPEVVVREIREYVEANRAGDSVFDIICEGQSPGGDPGRAASTVRPLAEAGATWWIESPWTPPNEPEDLRVRIKQGPPV